MSRRPYDRERSRSRSRRRRSSGGRVEPPWREPTRQEALTVARYTEVPGARNVCQPCFHCQKHGIRSFYVPKTASPTGHGYCTNTQCRRSHVNKEAAHQRRAAERRARAEAQAARQQELDRQALRRQQEESARKRHFEDMQQWAREEAAKVLQKEAKFEPKEEDEISSDAEEPPVMAQPVGPPGPSQSRGGQRHISVSPTGPRRSWKAPTSSPVPIRAMRADSEESSSAVKPLVLPPTPPGASKIHQSTRADGSVKVVYVFYPVATKTRGHASGSASTKEVKAEPTVKIEKRSK